MLNSKIHAPITDLFNQDYLSYFRENLSKYEENLLKIDSYTVNRTKKLKKWYKKDILHIELFKPFCPECYTKNVNKDQIKRRTLYFYDKRDVKTEIQSYKCKKCGKKF